MTTMNWLYVMVFLAGYFFGESVYLRKKNREFIVEIDKLKRRNEADWRVMRAYENAFWASLRREHELMDELRKEANRRDS